MSFGICAVFSHYLVRGLSSNYEGESLKNFLSVQWSDHPYEQTLSLEGSFFPLEKEFIEIERHKKEKKERLWRMLSICSLGE